jgi:hypothetical protein
VLGKGPTKASRLRLRLDNTTKQGEGCLLSRFIRELAVNPFSMYTNQPNKNHGRLFVREKRANGNQRGKTRYLLA